MKAFGLTGWSGSGKTTLMEHLVRRYTARGLQVSLIKHAHKGFDIDQPGKDSWRARAAGCREVLLTADRRWVLMHELADDEDVTLEDHLARLGPCDLVLVEGFKFASLPKLEVYRPSLGREPVFRQNPHVVAVASDGPVETSLPVLDLAAHDDIAAFVLRYLNLE